MSYPMLYPKLAIGTARGIGLGFCALSLFAGGCVTPGTGPGDSSGSPAWLRTISGGGSETAVADADLTPAERRMREQSKAFQKTVWEGILIGASAGTLWGVLQGDKGSDVLKKALVGGAVGGLAGAYLGHKQNQYSSKEDQLDSMIADVRQSNRETEELIASARDVIAEDKKRLAEVQSRLKKGKATEAEVASTRKRISENREVIAQAGKGAREKYKMFDGAEQELRQQSPGTDTSKLQKELKAYNAQIETLDGLAGSLSVA